ncbi:MAG: colicin E5-related ribonuclease [Coleofasciculus sp. G1-WW12-02]|jgi:hypothetical protein|uniref:colicin E5-related ribonuclease n=1 Tax=Coleofasciculus sp. G1-WW12-02 TaxID=3068483 RepID=UPI0032F8E122
MSNNEFNPKISIKIEKQLSKRGWTLESVMETINKPAYTKPTRDERHRSDATQANDPATAYYRNDDNYVICNDITGDIVQISNTFDLEWIDPLTF